MFYWDSSAIVAVLFNEGSGSQIRSFLERFPVQSAYTSAITFLEIESAIQRKFNERSMNLKTAEQGRTLAVGFRRSLQVIVLDFLTLDLGLHLQKLYNLRPGDAVQLASARVGTEDPLKVSFLCLDDQLNKAAKKEGFNVPFS